MTERPELDNGGRGDPATAFSGHKKACVALARKLAVILHRMLITGEAFRWPEKAAAATA